MDRFDDQNDQPLSLFLNPARIPPRDSEDAAELRGQLAIYENIISVLMRQVERSMDHHGNAFSSFQTAIVLEEQVRNRTDELRSALSDLEMSNTALVEAKNVAERSNAHKTKFLAAASHDLLQPLHAALLCMSALKEEAVDPKAGELISQIDRSLANVEQLLRMLLDISKLDAGATKPEICDFHLATILSGIQSDFATVAATNGLKFKTRRQDIVVTSDPVFLRRILQNLISNAIRYTSTGGVLIGCQRRGPNLRISVWDTGPGISEKHRPFIFEEFHRGEAGSMKRSEGLGLGLSIVKRMADALGHEITFSSVVGRGSRFSVSVPVSENQAVPPEHQLRKPSAKFLKVTPRIAVIEDDPNVLKAMETLLTRWSCVFVSGKSMSEIMARMQIHKRAPDMIIADYHLGAGENGIQCVKAIRDHYSANVKAVIITADRSEEVAQKAEDEQCIVLKKPIQPAELRALIRNILL